MKKFYYFLILICILSCKVGTPGKEIGQETGLQKGKLLFEDNFEEDLPKWRIEKEPKGTSVVRVANNKMDIDVAGGATVWFKKKISGDVMIEYKRRVVMKNGKNDRLSDLNQFWMAEDPGEKELLSRSGSFREYDNLRMYYAGIGGNRNTTTRFRKYPGNGERTLIFDLRDEKHLLEPNKTYLVQIVVKNDITALFVNGKEYFNYKDKAPLTEGYFGFRTVESHQEINDFRVFRLGDGN